MKQKSYIFYILVFALFLGITSPQLFTEGMFMDGVIYAAIAHNLSHGIGTFWDLHFTQTLYPHFHEHPPLAMGLQSLMYKAFGDYFWVERLYSFFTFIVSGTVMVLIAKNTVGNKEENNTSWLALLFWISVPLVTWSAANNMLENTMQIFVLLSVYWGVKSTQGKTLFYLTLSALALLLGVLSKGVVALYPLSLPFWLWLFNQKTKLNKWILTTLYYTIVLIALFGMLFILFPESKESLWAYVQKQIVGSLNNVKTVKTRFYILVVLIQELLPMLIMAGGIYWTTRKKTFHNPYKDKAMAFGALALSGVLPIMVSMKQSGFYILSTFPFFALSLWLFMLPRIQYLVSQLNLKHYQYIKKITYSLLIIALSLNVWQFGKLNKDKEKLEDIRKIAKEVPPYSILSIDPTLRSQWDLHAYFQRYYFISLDTQEPFHHNYIIVNKKFDASGLSGYQQVDVALNLCKLYEKK